MTTKRSLLALLLCGVLVGSTIQAGIPRLTVGFGCLFLGLVTGDQAWRNYKASSNFLGNLLSYVPKDKFFGIDASTIRVPNDSRAQSLYRHLDRYQESYKYGAASAACLGTGVYLLRKEFKTKSRHHKHDDCD